MKAQMDRSALPLRFGTLVVFTDGTDRAARLSREEMLDAIDAADFDVYAIGVGGEIDADELDQIGRDGFVRAENRDQIARAFEQVAARIEGYSRRFYLLSYCTQARAGEHDVTIEAEHEGQQGSVEYRFSADGFGPNCDPNRTPNFEARQRAAERRGEDGGERGRGRVRGRVTGGILTVVLSATMLACGKGSSPLEPGRGCLAGDAGAPGAAADGDLSEALFDPADFDALRAQTNDPWELLGEGCQDGPRIAKIPRSRRWRVMVGGHAVMSAALCLCHEHFPDALREAA